jgi:plastocyanin
MKVGVLTIARFHLAALLLAAVLLGCDQADIASPAAANAPAPEFHGVGGIVRGKVTVVGWTPSAAPANAVKCGDHTLRVGDESVVVSSNGLLSNAIVYLKSRPVSAANSAEPVVLDQVGCIYKPHVVALRTGQVLRVKSSDQTLHNVHMLSELNAGANFGMMQPGYKEVTFKVAERFRVRCDVHPWMNANVAVFDHPYFAVTAEAGEFEIKNIPPGDYELVAWQERFGELEQKVTIVAGIAADVTFTFKPSTNN